MKNIVLLLIVITSLGILFGCSDPPPGPITTTAPDYPKRILNSITSDFVFDNYTYPVKIYLPESYPTNKNLPIIYVLDGALNYDNVLHNIGFDTEAIVVGFGDFASKEKWQRRWIDLRPAESKCTGNNEGTHLDFYKFITKELIPYIDDLYDNDHNSRTLIGHSSAGLFTLVSMFLDNPKIMVFHNFIGSDPELGCDPAYFAEMLNNNDFATGSSKVKLYIAVSGHGDVIAVNKYAEDMQAKNYARLTFKYEEFLDEGHMSVLEPSFISGLKFILEN